MSKVNPFYEHPDVKTALRATWQAQRSVAVGSFFKEKIPVEKKWKRKYIPDKYNFEEHPYVPLQNEIRKFVRAITGKNPVYEGYHRFSHGDYTLLHDKLVQKPGIVALYFADDWKEEFGGKVVFMKNGETLESFVPRKNTLLIVERKKDVKYFVKYVNHKAKKKSFRIISG